jgi:hypothetical protein
VKCCRAEERNSQNSNKNALSGAIKYSVNENGRINKNISDVTAAPGKG